MTQQTPDSTAPITLQFRQLESFANISDDGLRALQEKGSLLRFRIGQALTTNAEIPKNVYWLLDGQCRLLGNEKGRLTTLARLNPGATIGLASLIRANPCESVSAATPVIVVAVPDELIVELYRTEPSFKTWCNQTIWPAEVAELIESHSKSNALSDNSLLNKLSTFAQNATCSQEQQRKN